MAKKSIKGVCPSIAQIRMDLGKIGISISSLFQRVVGMRDKTFFGKMLDVVV